MHISGGHRGTAPTGDIDIIGFCGKILEVIVVVFSHHIHSIQNLNYLQENLFMLKAFKF